MVATVRCVEGSVATNAKLARLMQLAHTEINPNLDLFEGDACGSLLGCIPLKDFVMWPGPEGSIS